MKIYLVGGAVRDQLLGRPIKERDWVVVGATPQQMLDLGYKQVGKDFPVFLHPETHEEYALARTERKTGRGYTGFTVYAAPDVTLEDDLQRRDLTINAMAQTTDDNIIDPYGGQRDLQQKILKHVSPAFAEDPVRILRVARFAARMGDFQIHPDTCQLMQQMVNAGEADDLVAERVWQELERALQEPYPQRFFEVLKDCHALEILFPEFAKQTEGISALKRAAAMYTDPVIRFGVLCYPLDKDTIQMLCKRYRVPVEYRDSAILISQLHTSYQHILLFSADQLLTLLESLDAFRRSERIDQFLLACQAIYPNDPYEQTADRLRIAFESAKSINTSSFIKPELTGPEIRAELRERRIVAIQQILQS